MFQCHGKIEEQRMLKNRLIRDEIKVFCRPENLVKYSKRLIQINGVF